MNKKHLVYFLSLLSLLNKKKYLVYFLSLLSLLTKKKPLLYFVSLLAFLSLLQLSSLLPPIISTEKKVIGRVERVMDGDSLRINGQRIRLYGLDAPELDQECCTQGEKWHCGRQARSALQDMTRKYTLSCISKGKDRYDRILGECYRDGDSVNSVNELLVEEGLALAYRRYSLEYVSQQERAERHKKGLWQGDFTQPEIWRRLSKEQKTRYSCRP